MFLVFSYLEFTMPFILCVVLACCCGDLGLIKGASSECIDSLPTYKFKLQKDGSGSIRKINLEVKGRAETAGTEKDCAIPGDDAVSFRKYYNHVVLFSPENHKSTYFICTLCRFAAFVWRVMPTMIC